MTLSSVKEKKSAVAADGQAEEVMAFCPQCKALQTVWLQGNVLLPTVKFTQQDNNIYHNCGSRRPCRLYFTR